MALHRSRHKFIVKTLRSIQDRRPWVRSWYVRGLMVGSWKSRSGKVYAVGHTTGGEVCLYNPRVCVPSHGWSDI